MIDHGVAKHSPTAQRCKRGEGSIWAGKLSGEESAKLPEQSKPNEESRQRSHRRIRVVCMATFRTKSENDKYKLLTAAKRLFPDLPLAEHQQPKADRCLGHHLGSLPIVAATNSVSRSICGVETAVLLATPLYETQECFQDGQHCRRLLGICQKIALEVLQPNLRAQSVLRSLKPVIVAAIAIAKQLLLV